MSREAALLKAADSCNCKSTVSEGYRLNQNSLEDVPDDVHQLAQLRPIVLQNFSSPWMPCGGMEVRHPSPNVGGENFPLTTANT